MNSTKRMKNIIQMKEIEKHLISAEIQISAFINEK